MRYLLEGKTFQHDCIAYYVVKALRLQRTLIFFFSLIEIFGDNEREREKHRWRLVTHYSTSDYSYFSDSNYQALSVQQKPAFYTDLIFCFKLRFLKEKNYVAFFKIRFT